MVSTFALKSLLQIPSNGDYSWRDTHIPIGLFDFQGGKLNLYDIRTIYVSMTLVIRRFASPAR